MAIIEWNDSFSVGVGKIDEQHKRLVDMINQLQEAMKNRKAKEVLEEILKGMIEYTLTHFRTEENYFDKFSYSGRAAHEKEHADFVAKVADFQKEFEAGRLALSIDILDFLSDWLKTHIKGSDMTYRACFQENGLS